MENNHEAFIVVGISTRTTNGNGQSSKDIPALWGRFMSEEMMEKIPGKAGPELYCIYTDYEKDHTKPYTTILGCRVKDDKHIPAGMVSKIIEPGNYTVFTAKGNMQEGAVYNEWVKIWNADLDRAFTTDYEVYGEKAHDPAHAEVDIFIAIK